jgi:hypothetical protein
MRFINNFFDWLIDTIDDPFGIRERKFTKAMKDWMKEADAHYLIQRNHFTPFSKPFPVFKYASYTKPVFYIIVYGVIFSFFFTLSTNEAPSTD